MASISRLINNMNKKNAEEIASNIGKQLTEIPFTSNEDAKKIKNDYMMKIKNRIESLSKEEIKNIAKNIDILEEEPKTETEQIIKIEEKKEEPQPKPKKE